MARIVALVLACVLCSVPCWAGKITLTTNGETSYRIIVDPEATVAEKHAADELAMFLNQVTGATFPITTATAVGFEPAIIVGPGQAARALATDVDFDKLHPDGLVIESRSPHLILAGERPRGTLYAVYSFLEDTVGCRWWTSKASTIPKKPTLEFEEPHNRFVPRLEYREPFWFDAFDADWAARNKSNGNSTRLDEARGGKVTYGGPYFVHTFAGLVPPEKYFKDHPEWFAEIGGKRLGGNGEYVQLCVTNDELKEFVANQVLDWLDKNPNVNIISVSQNDVDSHCKCAKCAALEAEEGSPSGPLLAFVNYVAEKVGQKYPNVAIDTLAYSYTRKPPLHVKPLPNVIVRLCSIECNFLQPLTDPSNASFRKDIERWSQICKRLYIWDYCTDFGHYMLPYPNLRVLGPNAKFFVEHGVKGVFEEGAYQSPGAEFAELKAWVLAKVLWEPDRDPEELIDQFVKGYYGAAAPYIREYINYLHDDAQSSGYYLGIGIPPTASFFTLSLMTKAEELFNKAEAAAKNDPELLNRVQVARLPIRYEWAMRWVDLQRQAKHQGIAWPGPADNVENAKTFMDVAKKNNITMLSEGSKIDAFAQRTVDLGRHAPTPPPGCEGLVEGEDYIDLQDSSFNLWNEGVGAMLKHDDRASDGVAVMMPGNHLEWATQEQLGVEGIDPKATYTCYVSIRGQRTGSEGLAFTYGLYDALNKKGIGGGQAMCTEVKDSEYHTYKVATTPLHGQMYLWVAPPKNPVNMKAVWVDRFWLVKEK